VGAGGFTGGLTGTTERTTNQGCEGFYLVLSIFGFHDLDSICFGLSPELSFSKGFVVGKLARRASGYGLVSAYREQQHEHTAPCQIGTKRGQPGGKQISVHEMNHTCVFR